MGISPLLTFASASALEFNFSSPAQVELNESFDVSISLDTQAVYDVKIYIYDPAIQTKEYAEILSGDVWERPFKFLISVFPSQNSFSIRTLKLGTYPICARLRETTKSYPCSNCGEVCRNITIIESSSPPPQSEPEPENNSIVNETEEDNSQSEEDEEEIEDNNQSAIQPVKSSSANSQSSSQEKDNEVIYLNKKPSSNSASSASTSFMTKDEKIRLWMAYGFAGLCILILILVLMRKL